MQRESTKDHLPGIRLTVSLFDKRAGLFIKFGRGFAVFAACTLSAFALINDSRSHAQQTSSVNGPSEDASSKLVLAFRMEQWTAAHFNDAAKATQHIEVLKQLGCEVKTVPHDGHTDVQCKTTFWKSLALENIEQVAKWKTWFDAYGFDTIHGYPATEKKATAAGEKPKEIVQFRQAAWKTIHAHEPQQVAQYLALYRALGCEIEEHEHDGHTDLKVRCSEWREMDLPSHEAAHKWQEFLIKAGFETKHEH